MKILQVSTFFHPVVGGVELHVYNLSRKLQVLGHEVEVLCSDSNKNAPRIKEKYSIVSGIKVRRFRTLFSLSFYHKFYPGLFWHLLRADYDIIHVHGFRKFETYQAMLAAFFRKKHVVLTSHNPFPVTTRSKLLNFLVAIHDKTFGRIFTRKLSRIITLLPSEKKIFQEKFHVPAEKLTAIPNGIDDIFFQSGNAEQFLKNWKIDRKQWQGVVVSVCRINFGKGLQNLEKSVKELPGVLFFFAGGDDGYLAKLKVIFATCSNVIFSKYFLPQSELVNLYAAADLFVLPSLHEAFGIVFLEALAQGCPVIATNRGGPAELLSDKVAVKLPPEDQRLWKENISKLLTDTEMRKKMVKESRVFAAHFNWDTIGKQTLRIYQEIVN